MEPDTDYAAPLRPMLDPMEGRRGPAGRWRPREVDADLRDELHKAAAIGETKIGKTASPDFVAPPPMGRVLGAPPEMAMEQPPGVLSQGQAQGLAAGTLEPFGQAGRLIGGASQDVPGDLASVGAAMAPIGPPGSGRALKAGLKVLDDGLRVNIAPRAMEIPEWGKGLTWGLTAYRSKVGGEDVLHVRDARLPPDMQGQGHGTAMYEHAADLAAKEKRPLVSDGTVTQDAANRWMALNRRGYTVQMAPDKVFRPGPPEAPQLGRFETPDGSPVFRVEAKPTERIGFKSVGAQRAVGETNKGEPAARAPGAAMETPEAAARRKAEMKAAYDELMGSQPKTEPALPPSAGGERIGFKSLGTKK